MTQRLEGKVAIITGATSGIGEATARRFAEEGATVILAGRTVEKGEKLAKELGGNAMFQKADVMQEADIAALVDTAKAKFGRLDCLFNNAGAGDRTTLDSVTEEEFAQVMRLLTGSVVFGIKHAARIMREQGSGCIINNSSIAAHRLGQGGYLYSGAKAAVSHLTRLAGVELGADGIRVNAISPGAVATPIFWGGSARANHLSDEENQAKMEKLEKNLARATPLPRAGLALDIANAAVFLASDEGSFINSHDLVVDGGRISMFNEKSG
ncbi:NADP-dependent 3-hydroxy acid dehydrogenase YdfG [Marinobacter daqiaonensis]|uniref:NADP-dependent 3-hydroxy acid dehydrogenase YdfG n=1 Tax=Marinobacter daqiaonensis TaxID=650891 RepID=A0A1I6I629_9GAMM|nr:SDR family oxidoreductase [Marinobacter daqiaonensis]SFR62195.1 NADP-dependent 3-hydroxy acid dehydrogenase YdfG [Marinobacter daqiaonensis]